MSETKTAPVTRALPLFYRRPRPLDAAKDRSLALRTPWNFGFAREAVGVVIGPVEFAPALRTYPIVFTINEPSAALAILAVEAGKNLFVGADGAWKSGAYIPAYVRRYPFVFLEQPQTNQLVLCIDEASDMVTQGEGRLLYEDGKASPVLQDALTFGRDFVRETRAGSAFVGALQKQGLLVRNAARIRLASGRETQVTDFHVIDEAKFNALPDDVVVEWRKKGWLRLVYAHLFSMANWAGLAELASGKNQASAAPGG